jgi:hypothetical protein
MFYILDCHPRELVKRVPLLLRHFLDLELGNPVAHPNHNWEQQSENDIDKYLEESHAFLPSLFPSFSIDW